MSETILVTGADGFIGRALVERLRDEGRAVVTLGRAQGDITRVETFEISEPIASVVHLAAKTYVPASWDRPAPLIETNVIGTNRVLEFCRMRSARLIYVSAYVYGEPDALPVAETAQVKPNNPYALSKHLAEQLCFFYAETMAVPVTIVRPFNAYGPGQDQRFLIPTVLEQVRNCEAIEVADLEPRRDLVFISDLIEAITVAAQRRAQPLELFNIGSGVSYSVAEIIETIQAVAGTRLEVKTRNSKRHNEISDVVADIRHARDVLGWRPQVGLVEGIRQCWLHRGHVSALQGLRP